MTTKVCTKCSLDLPFSEYYKELRGKYGLYAKCKSCHNKVCLRRYHANPEQVREVQRKWKQANPEQIRESNKRYCAENAEKIAKKNQKWAKDNPEKRKAQNQKWAKDNPEKVKAKLQKWRQRNPGRAKADHAKRRAAKKQAMPAWLSKSQIGEIVQIYETCPKGWHVDHVIPLRGATVSGLHVPWNLKSIPASENLRKSNKLIEVQ